MKQKKRLLAFALLITMLVPIMAMPAHALSTSVVTAAKAEIASFPEVYYLVSGRRTYVLALQSYLMRFNDTCKAKLKYGNTYMDGEYGGKTKDATAFAQSVLGVTADGYCGEKTWQAIANSLVASESGLYRRYSQHGDCFGIGRGGGDNLWFIGYITEDNWCVFINYLL